MRDTLVFFRQFRRRFQTTGSVVPSSRFLARALSGPLRERDDGRAVRVLEIGPGTGAVTRRIVRLLGREDRFDLVELNDVFADVLRERFETDPHYRRAAAQSRLHVCPVQEFDCGADYDYIISGLPLNNFDEQLVRSIFETYFRLLAPGGILSYFEYMYVRPLRRLLSGRAERSRLQALDEIMGEYLRRHRIRRDRVFANFPPAWVQHLRKD